MFVQKFIQLSAADYELIVVTEKKKLGDDTAE